jgi:hypothetical protein
MVTFNYKWKIFYLPVLLTAHFLLEQPAKERENHGSSIRTSANQTPLGVGNDAWVQSALLLTYVRFSYFHHDGCFELRMNGRNSIPCFAAQRIGSRINVGRFV